MVNADEIGRELLLDPFAAMSAATAIREALVGRRESFAFETVLSDPVGAKVTWLHAAAGSGYAVALCFIGLADARLSAERVAMRVSQGGHDVPPEKLVARYPRTLANLGRALRTLPEVRIYDNSDLGRPYRLLATCERGRCIARVDHLPAWLTPCLPGSRGSLKGRGGLKELMKGRRRERKRLPSDG